MCAVDNVCGVTEERTQRGKVDTAHKGKWYPSFEGKCHHRSAKCQCRNHSFCCWQPGHVSRLKSKLRPEKPEEDESEDEEGGEVEGGVWVHEGMCRVLELVPRLG